MVDDNFDVFFHLVCEYFIDYFCINVIKGNWSEILTLVSVSVDLGIMVTVIF
jgi:hydroxyethylthiazole kinase-like sugar kinase family protein